MNISDGEIAVNIKGFDINLIDVSYYSGCPETTTTPADEPVIEFLINTGSDMFNQFLEENYYDEIVEQAFDAVLNIIQDKNDNIADMKYQLKRDEGL